jgi:hypothetical protein
MMDAAMVLFGVLVLFGLIALVSGVRIAQEY